MLGTFSPAVDLDLFRRVVRTEGYVVERCIDRYFNLIDSCVENPCKCCSQDSSSHSRCCSAESHTQTANHSNIQYLNQSDDGCISNAHTNTDVSVTKNTDSGSNSSREAFPEKITGNFTPNIPHDEEHSFCIETERKKLDLAMNLTDHYEDHYEDHCKNSEEMEMDGQDLKSSHKKYGRRNGLTESQSKQIEVNRTEGASVKDVNDASGYSFENEQRDIFFTIFEGLIERPELTLFWNESYADIVQARTGASARGRSAAATTVTNGENEGSAEGKKEKDAKRKKLKEMETERENVLAQESENGDYTTVRSRRGSQSSYDNYQNNNAYGGRYKVGGGQMEREKEMEGEGEMEGDEREKVVERDMEIMKERERLMEDEEERDREKEIEMGKDMVWEWEKEVEREKDRVREHEKRVERERERAREKERWGEKDKDETRKLERNAEIEKEKIREKEREVEMEKEKKREKEREVEKGKNEVREMEKAIYKEKEKRREKEWEIERAGEVEKGVTEEDKIASFLSGEDVSAVMDRAVSIAIAQLEGEGDWDEFGYALDYTGDINEAHRGSDVRKDNANGSNSNSSLGNDHTNDRGNNSSNMYSSIYDLEEEGLSAELIATLTAADSESHSKAREGRKSSTQDALLRVVKNVFGNSNCRFSDHLILQVLLDSGYDIEMAVEALILRQQYQVMSHRCPLTLVLPSAVVLAITLSSHSTAE